MAAQDRNRAPQNPATAPIKPRWSAIGSPEADDRREPASPDRHTKTTPPRARQTPASLPPVRYPPIRESRRRPKRYGFFNSLLGDALRVVAYIDLFPSAALFASSSFDCRRIW